MTVLNIAEKPSVAKQIAALLSGNSFSMSEGQSKYNKNFRFPYSSPTFSDDMVVTSVLGHVTELDFPPQYSSWNGVDPKALFDAEVKTLPKKDMQKVIRNIEILSRTCQKVVLWLDCDREGEKIAHDVASICTRANPKLSGAGIYRARFSAIIRSQLTRALDHLDRLNERDVAAVEARQELDFRDGCAFTRFQSVEIKKQFNAVSGCVSYGPCQFPTLGFIVDRFDQIRDFKREEFWTIDVVVSKGEQEVKLYWARNHLFNQVAVYGFYKSCLADKTLLVKKVDEKSVTKYRPLPLTTVEMCKMVSRVYRLGSATVMKVAEGLYNRGMVSYPRTETDSFPQNFDHAKYLGNLKESPFLGLGKFVSEEMLGGNAGGEAGRLTANPRKGRKNDEAHPPIYPTKKVTAGEFARLTKDEKNVLEAVTRRYVACCAADAKGLETNVVGEVGVLGEQFRVKGLVVKEKGFLEVYGKYDKWVDKSVPIFSEGERFVPKRVEMKKSQTAPPSPLTEQALISLMDNNGIGTDATIAQHIQTVQTRNYAKKEGIYFYPLKLGYALVKSYDKIGVDLIKPLLRAELEANLQRISQGSNSGREVVRRYISKSKEIYGHVEERKGDFLDEFRNKYYDVSIGIGD